MHQGFCDTIYVHAVLALVSAEECDGDLRHDAMILCRMQRNSLGCVQLGPVLRVLLVKLGCTVRSLPLKSRLWSLDMASRELPSGI